MPESSNSQIFLDLYAVPVFGGRFHKKTARFGRFTRRWAILFEITVPQHHIPINHPCLMDEGCYGSCTYCFIWLGKPIANFKKAKQTLFGICVRLMVFVAVLIIFEAVLRQFLRVDFKKKGLYHSGVWFQTKRPEICSNCQKNSHLQAADGCRMMQSYPLAHHQTSKILKH